MTKETHKKGGTCFALIALNFLLTNLLSENNILYLIMLTWIFFHSAYIGSLFPDIDQRKSSISKRYPFLSKHLGTKCRHRGFTHSLLAFLALALFWEIILYISLFNEIILVIAFGFLCGYLSHLAFDIITSEGIELFYPCKINFSLGRIKTGTKGEKTFFKIITTFNYILMGYNVCLLILSIGA